MTIDDARTDAGRRPVPVAYERPRVERVLTPAELEREILYAGPPGTPDIDE
jgi:hypothetical protein